MDPNGVHLSGNECTEVTKRRLKRPGANTQCVRVQRIPRPTNVVAQVVLELADFKSWITLKDFSEDFYRKRAADYHVFITYAPL
jgi:hypothetical protein